ncbi:MAG: Tex-like N-terminal domain-containing protein, partial [Bacillota bacterium]|nr:Tex-like N-terminal domain-containing protein [Bacillota bacterium]
MDLLKTLSEEFSIKPANAENIISLIDGGNTIPFIARYRKEMTGSCDDQVLHEFSLRLQYLRNLDKRKKEIAESIASQGKMTEELARAVENAQTLTEAEDIYRPFRPKRRTRATIAEEKGLRPLAETLLRQDKKSEAPKELAAAFIDPEKGVNTLEEALTGAQDIIAEIISDDAETRKKLRALMKKDGSVQSKAAKKQNPVYQMYYDYAEPVSKIPGHRILAINRGEREEALKVSILLNEAGALSIVNAAFVKDEAPASSIVKDAGKDAWERLIYPSVEREVRSELTEKAVSQAINLFAMNLRPLLLTPPLKGRVTLGLDPAYRTGCKIAVVDETGKVLDTTVVYPTPPQSKTEEAKKELTRLINKHGVTAISIGNGTASKESEIFVAELIKELGAPVGYMMVNEAGASVYSASKLAA